jgi:hypothetical protein
MQAGGTHVQRLEEGHVERRRFRREILGVGRGKAGGVLGEKLQGVGFVEACEQRALETVRATMWMRARFDSAICTCDSMPRASNASLTTRSMRSRTWVLYFSRGTYSRQE